MRRLVAGVVVVAGLLLVPACAAVPTPTNLTLKPGVKSLTAKWGVSSKAGLQSFRVRWRPTGTLTWGLAATLAASAREYLISGLQVRSYDVQVRAVLTGGTLGGAAKATATPLAEATPHVVVVVEENRNRGQVVGSPAMPYFNSLLQKYGNTTAWDGVSHPSLPNYLALASGSTQGVSDDGCGYSFGGETIGSQLTAAGIGWRSYDEALPSAGSTACEAYPYAKKHNPFAYFSSSNGPKVVPASQFSTDLSGGKLPPFVFYVPGLCNDGHDCGNETVDKALEGIVKPVLTSSWYAEGGTIIVTWDEDEGEGKIATIVIHGPGEAKVLTSPGNHYGTLATIEDLYKVPRLGNAVGATTLTPLL